MTPESIKRELADVEASLDDAISYLVDLAGAKPTPMSPHNCRIHLDHARMYAMRLADAAIESLSAQSAQPQAGEAVAWRWPHPLWPKSRYKFQIGSADPGDVVGKEPLYATPQPANPAQVTDAMVNAVLTWVCDDVLPAYDIPSDVPRNDPELPDSCRAALTAAIGAGGQAVAEDAETLKARAASVLCEAGALCGWPAPNCNAREGAEALFKAGLLALSQPHPADERVVEALRAKVEEIRARVEKTICPTFSSDGGDQGEQGRITRQDFDTLVLAALAQEGRKDD